MNCLVRAFTINFGILADLRPTLSAADSFGKTIPRVATIRMLDPPSLVWEGWAGDAGQHITDH